MIDDETFAKIKDFHDAARFQEPGSALPNGEVIARLNRAWTAAPGPRWNGEGPLPDVELVSMAATALDDAVGDRLWSAPRQTLEEGRCPKGTRVAERPDVLTAHPAP